VGHDEPALLCVEALALNSSAPFITAHLKSLMDYTPSQGGDTLSLKKALEEAQKKLAAAHSSH